MLYSLFKLLFEKKTNALRYIVVTLQSNFAHLYFQVNTAFSGVNPHEGNKIICPPSLEGRGDRLSGEGICRQLRWIFFSWNSLRRLKILGSTPLTLGKDSRK
jgi:hypothetical protein